MRIIIDIGHPAHVNFFKNALRLMAAQGDEILITGLRRGKLPKIIENELSEFPVTYVGKHQGTKWSIIVDANLRKLGNLLLFNAKKRADIGLSVGSFTLGSVLKLFGKPNIQFDDDPERKMNVFLEKLTSSRLFFPPIMESNGKVSTMNALKEWAYLTPRYFQPRTDELERYGVSPKGYIFVREISTGSLNYQHQKANIIASFASQLPSKYPVLLSLEDKNTISQYPSHWILLQEPVRDIHSLIYHSKMIISSGDSMAREGAMLGVPAIYCGSREMKANQLLIDKGMLFKLTAKEAPTFIRQILNGEKAIPGQTRFRQQLLEEWDDVTEFIMSQVNYYRKKNQIPDSCKQPGVIY